MHLLNKTLLVLSSLALTGCFDPTPSDSTESDDTDHTSTGAGTGTNGGGTGSSGAPGDTDPPPQPTGAPADSTGSDSDTGEPVDMPPSFDSFTVNGAAKPEPMNRADIVIVAAEVSDDVGVDRVEFFEDDRLLSTDSEPPFQYEVVLASQHNGTHSYHAVAFDSEEQSAQSDDVELPIVIDGGATLTLREDIGDVNLSQTTVGAPRVSTTAERVVVAGDGRVGAAGSPSRLLTRGYSPDLSLQWGSEQPLASSQASRPTMSPDGSTMWFTAKYSAGPSDTTASLLTMSPDTGSLLDTQELFTYESYYHIGSWPLTVFADGDLLLATNTGSVSRLPPKSETATWAHTFENATVFEVVETGDGGAVVAYHDGDDDQLSIRKLTPDGNTEWTRDVGSMFSPVWRGPVLVALDERIIIMEGSAGVDLPVFSASGKSLPPLSIGGFDEYRAFDATFTPTNALVIVGRSPDNAVWLAAVDEALEIIWTRQFAIGTTDCYATGVASTPDGRLYMTGVENLYDVQILSASAETWVAEIAL